jgi:hypothetical protein
MRYVEHKAGKVAPLAIDMQHPPPSQIHHTETFFASCILQLWILLQRRPRRSPTAASVQALVDAIHNSEPIAAVSPSHCLSLSSFWREDPVGWFHYAEVDFVVANMQLNSYL